MADVTEERVTIDENEVAYRSAVSEATMTRVGASINFITKRQYDTKQFFINGPYTIGSGDAAVDGANMMLFDAEIVGVMMFNIVAGSSGTTTLDILRRTASGGAGVSIFSTKPSIDSTAGNYAWVARRLIPTNTILENPSGTTAPVISTINLDAGDLLSLDITAAQVGAENAGVVVYYRPR